METAHPRAYQKKTAGNIPHAMKFYTYYQQSLNKYLTLGQFLKVLSVCEGCFDLKRTLIHLDNKITTGCCWLYLGLNCHLLLPENLLGVKTEKGLGFFENGISEIEINYAVV